MFLMWLGLNRLLSAVSVTVSQSSSCFAGMRCGTPPAIAHTIEQARPRRPALSSCCLLLVCGSTFAVTFFVKVFVERGQRRIVVNYAKRQQVVVSTMLHRARTFTAESEYGGVIPAILSFQYYSVPKRPSRHGSGAVLVGTVTTISLYLQLWATALCVTLCVCNHLLLFLLHGVGFQPARQQIT